MIELQAERFSSPAAPASSAARSCGLWSSAARRSAASTTILAGQPSGSATCSTESSWSSATSAIRPRLRGRPGGGLGLSSRLHQRHRVLLRPARADPGSRGQGHDERARRLPRRGGARPDRRLQLGGVPECRQMSRRRRTCRWSSPTSPIPGSRTAAGKIVSELLAFNYGRKHFDRVLSSSGRTTSTGRTWARSTSSRSSPCACGGPLRDTTGTVRFPIQGTGRETRAFMYIDDFTEGLVRVIERGEHLNVYHIGMPGEVTIAEGRAPGRRLLRARDRDRARRAAAGQHRPALPDITKLQALGFAPVTVETGIAKTVAWYRNPVYA